MSLGWTGVSWCPLVARTRPPPPWQWDGKPSHLPVPASAGAVNCSQKTVSTVSYSQHRNWISQPWDIQMFYNDNIKISTNWSHVLNPPPKKKHAPVCKEEIVFNCWLEICALLSLAPWKLPTFVIFQKCISTLLISTLYQFSFCFRK